MKLRVKFFTLLASLLLASNSSLFSQSDQYVGIECGFGSSIDKINQTAVGISYENRFTNHFGVESGIFSRNSFTSDYKYRHLEIPVSIKFYSKAFNLSAGINSGLFTGAKSYSDGETLSWNKPFNFDVLVKLSHDFDVSSAFTLEPEIICIPVTTSKVNNSVGFGVGIKLKYLL
ncbi:exported hypothetical protein [uncultured Paludibacter sp.]|uniref:Outer membrane protein beta-barrel domain-containing protein n=1 Tax=uncultured Paludibacter sp. TaxID=497635 RepID=A0A653A9S9_9BACT|nr:exported hypothetical protein [uncultured Paludibacter sp.]